LVVIALLVGALSIAGAVLLIVDMDSPFEGMIVVSADPMQEALAKMNAPRVLATGCESRVQPVHRRPLERPFPTTTSTSTAPIGMAAKRRFLPVGVEPNVRF
jgi:hypothetical protein